MNFGSYNSEKAKPVKSLWSKQFYWGWTLLMGGLPPLRMKTHNLYDYNDNKDFYS